MQPNINILLNVVVIAGLFLSEFIKHTSCLPKRGVSLPRRSYMIPHISISMAASNFRKASASQQNFNGQRPSGRSQNIIQYQIGKNFCI